LITVSAETDEEGDSTDARENRSGHFIIRGIMKTLTPTRERHQCGLKQAKVTGNSRDNPILGNDRFREDCRQALPDSDVEELNVSGRPFLKQYFRKVILVASF
jgi:hypothetical protein